MELYQLAEDYFSPDAARHNAATLSFDALLKRPPCQVLALVSESFANSDNPQVSILSFELISRLMGSTVILSRNSPVPGAFPGAQFLQNSGGTLSADEVTDFAESLLRMYIQRFTTSTPNSRLYCTQILRALCRIVELTSTTVVFDDMLAGFVTHCMTNKITQPILTLFQAEFAKTMLSKVFIMEVIKHSVFSVKDASPQLQTLVQGGVQGADPTPDLRAFLAGIRDALQLIVTSLALHTGVAFAAQDEPFSLVHVSGYMYAFYDVSSCASTSSLGDAQSPSEYDLSFATALYNGLRAVLLLLRSGFPDGDLLATVAGAAFDILYFLFMVDDFSSASKEAPLSFHINSLADVVCSLDIAQAAALRGFFRGMGRVLYALRYNTRVHTLFSVRANFVGLVAKVKDVTVFLLLGEFLPSADLAAPEPPALLPILERFSLSGGQLCSAETYLDTCALLLFWSKFALSLNYTQPCTAEHTRVWGLCRTLTAEIYSCYLLSLAQESVCFFAEDAENLFAISAERCTTFVGRKASTAEFPTIDVIQDYFRAAGALSTNYKTRFRGCLSIVAGNDHFDITDFGVTGKGTTRLFESTVPHLECEAIDNLAANFQCPLLRQLCDLIERLFGQYQELLMAVATPQFAATLAAGFDDGVRHHLVQVFSLECALAFFVSHALLILKVTKYNMLSTEEVAREVRRAICLLVTVLCRSTASTLGAELPYDRLLGGDGLRFIYCFTNRPSCNLLSLAKVEIVDYIFEFMTRSYFRSTVVEVCKALGDMQVVSTVYTRDAQTPVPDEYGFTVVDEPAVDEQATLVPLLADAIFAVNSQYCALTTTVPAPAGSIAFRHPLFGTTMFMDQTQRGFEIAQEIVRHRIFGFCEMPAITRAFCSCDPVVNVAQGLYIAPMLQYFAFNRTNISCNFNIYRHFYSQLCTLLQKQAANKKSCLAVLISTLVNMVNLFLLDDPLGRLEFFCTANNIAEFTQGCMDPGVSMRVNLAVNSFFVMQEGAVDAQAALQATAPGHPHYAQKQTLFGLIVSSLLGVLQSIYDYSVGVQIFHNVLASKIETLCLVSMQFQLHSDLLLNLLVLLHQFADAKVADQCARRGVDRVGAASALFAEQVTTAVCGLMALPLKCQNVICNAKETLGMGADPAQTSGMYADVSACEGLIKASCDRPAAQIRALAGKGYSPLELLMLEGAAQCAACLECAGLSQQQKYAYIASKEEFLLAAVTEQRLFEKLASILQLVCTDIQKHRATVPRLLSLVSLIPHEWIINKEYHREESFFRSLSSLLSDVAVGCPDVLGLGSVASIRSIFSLIHEVIAHCTVGEGVKSQMMRALRSIYYFLCIAQKSYGLAVSYKSLGQDVSSLFSGSNACTGVILESLELFTVATMFDERTTKHAMQLYSAVTGECTRESLAHMLSGAQVVEQLSGPLAGDDYPAAFPCSAEFERDVMFRSLCKLVEICASKEITSLLSCAEIIFFISRLADTDSLATRIAKRHNGQFAKIADALMAYKEVSALDAEKSLAFANTAMDALREIADAASNK